MFHQVCLIFVLGFSITQALGIDNRIIGGVPTTIRESPYQLTLDYKEQHICGGSLITNKCVLTAGHCIESLMWPDMIVVRGGMTRLSERGVSQRISRIFKHENFNLETMNNDVAILRLRGPLQGQNIKTIKLTNRTVAVGEQVEITGFGYTNENITNNSNVLREVLVNVISQKECKKAYQGANNVTEGMFCATVKGGKKDACQGDSGGPVVSKNELVGVVSWGIGCGRPEYPGVFANVKYFRSWIDNIVSKYC
ncbi:trypsin beta-like [Eupeodes corollae]|uniref:trypsin beta-like n=1 Tax=Eupeodes corollae TaxID=290404 RepID=UPI002491F62E|nr:trypsin beta-like [Eupeodes corollae]